MTAAPPGPAPLDASRLRRTCQLAGLAFTTTDELADLGELPGQGRAIEAIRFGVAMAHDGYNLFVLGPPGSGRGTAVRQLLGTAAAGRAVPGDWCYVNNFADPVRPRALALPAGRGRALRDEVARLVDELRTVIPGIFEREEFRARVEEINAGFADREHQALAALAEDATAQQVVLMRTPGGFVLAPAKDGEAMEPEAFAKLPEAERDRLRRVIAALEERLGKLLRQIPQWMRERREQLRALDRQYVMTAVGQAIDELVAHFSDLPGVLAWIEALRADVIENAGAFRASRDESPGPLPAPGGDLRRYQVNLVVDHAGTTAAPVVHEEHPTHHNLLGRVEHVERFGALSTDFTLIRGGALHRANGGYLVLDARQLLSQPFAWDSLKRALRTREIRLESVAQMLSLVSTRSLEPQPVPLDVKVVLVGERLLYYLLYEYDPDFRELFKVAADFDDVVDRDPDSEALYARLVATLARRHGLLPLDRAAVCAVIDRAARLAGDGERLTTAVERVADLLREADHAARSRAAPCTAAEDVAAAVAAQRHRAGRPGDRMRDAIVRGMLVIDTAGTETGQVNGLAVFPLGEFAFAQPTRITATVRLGEGEVIDIEREARLGGNVHSKAMMILTAYVASRYATDTPLSLEARVAFEQTYGGIEGDSASVAELCALLSAVGDFPLRQDLAVTGSIDQFGRVQAVGAINEKVEGFFDLCMARGLSGTQGVVIPAANVAHLMLREDVLAACAAGRFHVYAADHADEVLELLSGLPTGEPDAEGILPSGCLAARIMERLAGFFALRREYSVTLGSHAGNDGRGNQAPVTPPAGQL